MPDEKAPTPETLDPDDLSDLGFLASNLIAGEKGGEIADLASRMAATWRIQRGQLRAARERIEALEFDVGFWRFWAVRLEPRLDVLATEQHITAGDVLEEAALAQEKPG